MRTRLSTPLTIFYKVVLPSLYLLCMVFIIAVWCGHGRGWKHLEWISTPASPLWTAVAVLGQLAGFAWLTIPLKKVEMDDTSLYVSNFRTEIQIPLTEITGLCETSSYWFTIIVTLGNKSSFGHTIVFRPRHRFYLSGLHPITRQISELAEQARRGAASRGQKDAHSK